MADRDKDNVNGSSADVTLDKVSLASCNRNFISLDSGLEFDPHSGEFYEATITNIDELPLESDKCINYANEKELSYHSKSEPEISSCSKLPESTSGNVVLNKLLAQNQLLINKLCEISTQGYNPRQQGEETDSDLEEEPVVVDSPLQP